ncbi:hypothetical protein [Roseisolibacter sp. H3M3-2]|uniref:hypothetical protein n=1 Tax=Roseisolibacter sp. H3M3-2 TaxID=3031323 RepID=UPI0023DBBCA2|nr:hypothetical protein [Roseisolibacter sp. H3M3-2]MDF1505778.1 hypothetical protein [Roseisolibacter sp. H3M3-2]
MASDFAADEAAAGAADPGALLDALAPERRDAERAAAEYGAWAADALARGEGAA